MTPRSATLLCMLLALCVSSVRAASPVIDSAEIAFTPGNSVLTTDTVTMSVTAHSPDGLTLSYTWDFGDGTPSVVTTTGSTSHVFAVEGDYLVDVTVSDGVNPSDTQSDFIAVVQAPATTSSAGVDSGVVKVNPDNGFSVTVLTDAEGVIQLSISDTPRGTNNFDTAFSDAPGRNFTGNRPIHQFDNPGIFTATTRVTDSGSGSDVGKLRKTVALGNKDLGKQPLVTNEPGSHTPTVSKLKGKVNFADTTKNDTLSVTWDIELPEGLDLSRPQDITLSVGNLTETITLDVKGKGVGVLLYKNIKVKYPRLPKDVTATTPGLHATVTAQLFGTGLVNAGLDTEGITARAKTGTPNIQIEMLLAGVAYSTSADVEVKVAKNQATAIVGRLAQ